MNVRARLQGFFCIFSINKMKLPFFVLVYLFLFLGVTSIVNAESANLEVVIPSSYHDVEQGTEVWFTINIINLENSDRRDILLTSQIVDDFGKIYSEKSKTVAIETQASFVHSIVVSKDLPPGKYYIKSIAQYDNDTIFAKQEIVVISPRTQLAYYMLIGIFFVVILTMLIWFYASHIGKWRLHARIRNIVNKKLRK